MKNEQNLTTPADVIAAIMKKDGSPRGYITRLAKRIPADRSALSANIHQYPGRKQEYILKGIANYIGVGVYGVYPDQPEQKNAA